MTTSKGKTMADKIARWLLIAATITLSVQIVPALIKPSLTGG